MKNNVKFEQVIMTIYPQLDSIENQLSQKITNLAVGSHRVVNATLRQMDEILSLIEKRNKLLDFKDKLSLVLSRLDEEDLKILQHKYIDKRAIEGLNCSVRHYYRKLNKALDYFKTLLGYIGITEEIFYNDFGYIFPKQPFTVAKKTKQEQVSKKEIA